MSTATTFAAGSTESPRNNKIDILRGLLIILVVFGHFLQSFVDFSESTRLLFFSVYTFHMPLFVMLSGIFSKQILEKKDYKNIIERLIIPLVVFQIFYLVLGRILQGHFTRPMTQPFGPLWFLLSLVFWRLTIPIFSRTKFPVLIAILLPLLAGYDPQIGYSFSLSRTLYFFPFYVLGYFYGIRIVNHVNENRILYILIFVIAMIFSVFALQPNLPADILYGSSGYQQLPAATSTFYDLIKPLATRIFIIAFSFLCAISVTALSPRNSRFLSYIGERTLGVYLLHLAPVLVLAKLSSKFSGHSGPAILLGCLFLSIGVTAFLALLDKPLNQTLAYFYKRLTAN